jgi:hypothetical protein
MSKLNKRHAIVFRKSCSFYEKFKKWIVPIKLTSNRGLKMGHFRYTMSPIAGIVSIVPCWQWFLNWGETTASKRTTFYRACAKITWWEVTNFDFTSCSPLSVNKRGIVLFYPLCFVCGFICCLSVLIERLFNSTRSSQFMYRF